MNNKHSSIFSHFFHILQTFFLEGLFAIFPLSITIVVLTFAYHLLDTWLLPLQSLGPLWLQNIPGSKLILVVSFIFLIGILVKLLIIGPILHHIELIFSKIPFVKTIHSSLKALAHFFNHEDNHDSDRQVVLVHFPQKDYYNIGFLLGNASFYEQLIPKEQLKKEPYYRIFLPTSPVPGHGFFMIVPESEIIKTNLSFEEAIKICVSCGLIDPEQPLSLKE